MATTTQQLICEEGKKGVVRSQGEQQQIALGSSVWRLPRTPGVIFHDSGKWSGSGSSEMKIKKEREVGCWEKKSKDIKLLFIMDGKRKRSATKEVPPTTRATRSSSSSKITTTNGTTTPKPTPKKAKTTKKEGKKETAIENEVVQEIKKEEDKKPKEVTPEEVVEAEPELPAPQPELDFVGLEAIDSTVDTKNSQPKPEIPLPPNYLTLEHQFNALLTAIVFIRGRRLPPIWTNIQKPIEDFSGKYVS